MVTTPIDPIKPSVLCLTEDETNEIKASIAAGLLPPDWFERCQEAQARNVFGADAVKDKHGNFVEQGIGAKGRETLNHFNALKKAEAMGMELPGSYDREVAAMWKNFPDRAKKIGLQAVTR
jgi:hypothetical protein